MEEDYTRESYIQEEDNDHLFDILQFETLVQSLGYEGIIKLCQTSRKYKSICEQPEVWKSLIRKDFRVKSTWEDPRQEYLTRKLNIRNIAYETIKFNFEDEYIFRRVPGASLLGNIPLMLKTLYKRLLRYHNPSDTYYVKLDLEGVDRLIKSSVTVMLIMGGISCGKNNKVDYFAEMKPEFISLLKPWEKPLQEFIQNTGTSFDLSTIGPLEQIIPPFSIKMIFPKGVSYKILKLLVDSGIYDLNKETAIEFIKLMYNLGCIEPDDDRDDGHYSIRNIHNYMKEVAETLYVKYGKDLPNFNYIYTELFGKNTTIIRQFPRSPMRRRSYGIS